MSKQVLCLSRIYEFHDRLFKIQPSDESRQEDDQPEDKGQAHFPVDPKKNIVPGSFYFFTQFHDEVWLKRRSGQLPDFQYIFKRTCLIAYQDKYVFVSVRAMLVDGPMDLLQDSTIILFAVIPADDDRYVVIRASTFTRITELGT